MLHCSLFSRRNDDVWNTAPKDYRKSILSCFKIDRMCFSTWDGCLGKKWRIAKKCSRCTYYQVLESFSAKNSIGFHVSAKKPIEVCGRKNIFLNLPFSFKKNAGLSLYLA